MLNVCRMLPAVRPEEALRMDGLLVSALSAAARRQAEKESDAGGSGRAGRSDGDGRWQTNPHTGQRTMTIRSMDTLARVLGGRAE